ncbi:MAG: DUF2281 domain-containing protein [Butyrivibrio sp.]|nr:DUF2281 domain-containing protein [Butyrivibrio sp.]
MSVDTLLNEVNGLSEERLDEVITFPGGLSGTFVMADDFDETPDCFKEYV